MTVEKFIELVEKLADVDNIYEDIDEHPGVHRKRVAEAIADGFNKAKVVLLILPET